MAGSISTQDHEVIRKWVEDRKGKPAIVNGTESMLRVKFDENEQDLNETDWDNFFKIFDERKLHFLYDPDENSRFFKFIYAGHKE